MSTALAPPALTLDENHVYRVGGLIQSLLPFSDGAWLQIKDADPDARTLFHRHYSHRKYADGRDPKKFIGPGEYIALMTPNRDALFVWRKFINPRDEGVNCAIFRNESVLLSSALILEAETWARERWPGQRLYTYINPRKVRSANPGCCFEKAGWRKCDVTKRHKLIVMEKSL